MTEPVAYMWKTERGTILGLEPNDNSHSGGRLGIPLYTKEQLHPRVKMTQKQYDRLMWEKSHTNLLACIDYFFEKDDNYFFGLSSENLRGDLTQTDIARAWLNPEETIEIVPDMKWFVRSKELAKNSKYLWLCDTEYLDVPQCMFTNDNQLSAMGFDTKEEAEKWTNPLTEAVQLPVEGE